MMFSLLYVISREWSNEYDDRPYHHPRGGGGDSERSDQNDHRRSDRRDRHLRSTSPLHHTGNHRYGYGSGGSSSSSRRDESRDRRQRWVGGYMIGILFILTMLCQHLVYLH